MKTITSSKPSYRRAVFTFAFLVSLLLHLPPMVSAQQRRVMNGGTVTSGLTITAPQSIIEMNGVTFTGGIAIQIDISGMSSTTRPVWVTICNCQFLNGATIYFIGDDNAVDTKKPVYITFEGTKFTDGALGFKGYFPPLTRIVIAHVTVLINNRLVVLPLWNPFNWGGGDNRYAYSSEQNPRFCSLVATLAALGLADPNCMHTRHSPSALMAFSTSTIALHCGSATSPPQKCSCSTATEPSVQPPYPVWCLRT
ncbi:unnamed protein product [Bodo saltans]|uniref:Membrane-associated protein n=1 Tax=Bodo saltans TaxID=75058 RepID=A0A0S4IR20_BODSA|nr:unnamed protein product [Bodo saltans]|eukprot:CUF26586.1 unnamed protein product [Bodo saltans]